MVIDLLGTEPSYGGEKNRSMREREREREREKEKEREKMDIKYY